MERGGSEIWHVGWGFEEGGGEECEVGLEGTDKSARWG